MTRLVLRGDFIERRALTNPHALSLKIGVSYATMLKYVHKPETVQVVDLETLGNLLVTGMGMTKEEAANLRLGDVFKFVD